jgi:periplasmic protein TonB
MSLAAIRPWQLSFLVHASLVLAFVSLTLLKIPEAEVYEVPIEVNSPQEIQNLTEVKEKPKVVLKSVNEPIPEIKPAREVFGANRNSYTDSTLGSEGVEIKKGNTLAKEVDNTKLEAGDADSLPTPTEEYLVSDMPSVLSEVRPVYPKEARDKQLEGTVALDVLIDEKGLVRQVTVIEGLEIFRQPAINAMKNYKFRPAKVDGKSVAVRIRYSINFQLEY